MQLTEIRMLFYRSVQLVWHYQHKIQYSLCTIDWQEVFCLCNFSANVNVDIFFLLLDYEMQNTIFSRIPLTIVSFFKSFVSCSFQHLSVIRMRDVYKALALCLRFYHTGKPYHIQSLHNEYVPGLLPRQLLPSGKERFSEYLFGT